MGKKQIQPWKVLQSEDLFKEPWFTVRRDKVELPNGSLIPSYYVLEYPAWVCVIGITREGKLLMERQYRHGLGRVGYELCAGVVEDSDPSYLEAARRELWEETGYGKGHWETYMVFSVNPGTHTNLTYCFLATDLERIGEPHQEATEDIAIELLEPEEVKELLMENQIMQAMHVAALWKYFYEKTKADEDGAGKSGISEKFCDR